MPSLEGAFVLRDGASRKLKDIRDNALAADAALSKLGLTMDGISSSRRAQQLQTVARTTRQLGVDADGAARRMGNLERATRGADRSLQGWGGRLRMVVSGVKDFARELMPFVRPAGMLYGFGALIGVAAQAIGNLAGGVVALTPRLVDMGSALAALVPVYVGVGGAAMLMSSAMKELSTAMGGGPQGAQALRAMGREGAVVVRQLRAMRLELRQLRQAGTTPIFRGLAQSIPTLRARGLPAARGIMGQIGGAVGGLIPQATQMLTGRGTLRDLAAVGGAGAGAVRQLGSAAISLAHALLGVGAAAAPLTMWLTRSIAGWAELRARHIDAERSSGQLAIRFQRVRHELAQTWQFLRNVGHALKAVFEDARPAGEQLYNSLLGTSRAWSQMADSTERNVRLTRDFLRIADGFKGLARLAATIGRVFFQMGTSQGLPRITDQLSAMLPQLGRFLSQLGQTFGPPIVQLLGTFSRTLEQLSGTQGPFVTLLNTVNSLVSGFNRLMGVLGPFKSVLGSALELGLLVRFAAKIGLIEIGWRRVAVAAGQAAIAEGAASSGGFGIRAGPLLGPMGRSAAGVTTGEGFLGGIALARVLRQYRAGRASQYVATGAGTLDLETATYGGALATAGRGLLGGLGKVALPLLLLSGAFGALGAPRRGGFGQQAGDVTYGALNALTMGGLGAGIHAFGMKTPEDYARADEAAKTQYQTMLEENRARGLVVKQLEAERQVRGAGRGNEVVQALNRVYQQAGGGARGFAAARAAAFSQLTRYPGTGTVNTAARAAIESGLVGGLPAGMRRSTVSQIIGLEASQGNRVRYGGGQFFVGPQDFGDTGPQQRLQMLRSRATLPGAFRGASGKLLSGQILALLQAMGMSAAQAQRSLRRFIARGQRGSLYTAGSGFTEEQLPPRAAGGRVPGAGVHDTVPLAMAAPGELVVNRHTERRVNYLLGGSGHTLGGLVSGETTPHSARYAKGGRARSLQAGIASDAGIVLSHFPGLQVTSTTEGRHAANSYHYRGMAVDIGGSPTLMNRAARWIFANMGGSLLEGIHNPGLSVKNGQPVAPSFWGAKTWAGHRDHIHLAASVGGLGALAAMARAGIAGAGAGAAQAARGAGVGSIFDPLATATASMFGLGGIHFSHGLATTPGGIGAGAGAPAAPGANYSKASLVRLASYTGFPNPNMAAAVALAESRGVSTAHNTNAATGDNSYGLMQINMLGAMGPARRRQFGLASNDALFNPATNMRVAFGLSNGGTDFSPWSTYKSGAYQQYLSRGGRAWGGWHQGGLDAVFNTPTAIGVGDGGPERVTVTPKGKSAPGGVVFHNYFTIHGGAPGQVQREIEAALQTFADQLERHYGSDVA